MGAAGTRTARKITARRMAPEINGATFIHQPSFAQDNLMTTKWTRGLLGGISGGQNFFPIARFCYLHMTNSIQVVGCSPSDVPGSAALLT